MTFGEAIKSILYCILKNPRGTLFPLPAWLFDCNTVKVFLTLSWMTSWTSYTTGIAHSKII